MNKKTKTIITILLLVIVVIATILIVKLKMSDRKSNDNMTTIQLNEVTR